MLQEDYTPLTFAPVISYKLVAGVFRFARGGCFLFSFYSPQSTRSFSLFANCHPDERSEEGSREHKVGCNVDVHEILRRHAPLDDNDDGEERKYSVRLRVTRW